MGSLPEGGLPDTYNFIGLVRSRSLLRIERKQTISDTVVSPTNHHHHQPKGAS